MNVLTIIHEFPPLGGGGGVVARDLAAELVRRGHSVDLVTMSFRGLPREEIAQGVRIFRVPSLRRHQARCSVPEMLSFVASAAPFLLKFTRRKAYDAVHCHFAVPAGPLAALLRARRGLPYILTCHGSDVPGHNIDRFKFAHRFTLPVLRQALSRAAAVTAPSNFMKDRVHHRICECDVRVIPNGIHPENRPAGDKRNLILMGGRLLRMKGFHNVLLALDGVESDFEVHVIGDGVMRSELERLAARLRMPVVFHGWLPPQGQELRRLFAEAAIFCMPSAAESFGLVFLEAMCAGCAVLGSTAGGIPDVVRDGETGLLVPPDDIPATRAALLRLMGDPALRRRLAEASMAEARAKFTWDVVASQFERLLFEISGREALEPR